MIKKILFLSPLFCWAASLCVFTPPEGWQAAQPKQLSEHVQIGFVGKGSTEFHPSINLATEEIDCSLKEYVKAVKEIHTAQPNTTWRDLGKIQMKSGKGELTEITTTTPFGPIHMLQAIYVEKNIAYIVTAAVHKDDFLSQKQSIFKAIQSLQLVDSLATPIADLKLKNDFEAMFSQLGASSEEQRSDQWNQLQKFIVDKTGAMGGYWQFLALKEGYDKIHRKSP